MENLKLADIQFYWRMTEAPNSPPNVVADFLPFEFTFREDIQLLMQSRNPAVLAALERVYLEEWNVGYLQEGHALAQSYGDDVIRFIRRAIKKYHPAAEKIIEVGCGGGYLLNRLKGEGFAVLGIDPSPVAVKAGEELGYQVVKDFYPLKTPIEKGDVFLHYDVLEHTEDPVAFLREHKEELSDNGIICFAVPDVSGAIELGDISMVIHEHLNFFDAESIRLTVEQAGFEPLEIEQSDHGGVYYCAARKSAARPAKGAGRGKFDDFCRKQQRLGEAVQSYIDQVLADEENTLGFYVPLRAFPYLGKERPSGRIRFFDDDPGLHRQYFDGYDIPVENRAHLAAKPVSHLIISSFSFGERIRQNVLREVSAPMEIKSLADF